MELKSLNPLALGVKPSGIRRYFDMAATLPDCISLGVGEPCLTCPPSAKREGIRRIKNGGKYSPNAGIFELRKAISKYLESFIGVGYSPESEIIVTVGASEGVDLAIRTLCACGDEVIIPAPCYVSYPPLVSLAGGKPVLVDCDEFTLPKAIESAITPATKAIILNYPNNPTGMTLPLATLKKLAEVAKCYGLYVVSDEIYAELNYSDEQFHSIAEFDGMRERTIIVSGFSKSFAMTGWRIGYVCAPKEICEVMYRLHQYQTMCAPTISQYAALAALEDSRRQNYIDEAVRFYNKNMRYLCDRLAKMGLTCPPPGGAFYAFPSIENLNISDEKFADNLLKEQRVLVVPGSAFYADGSHIRISYALSSRLLATALDRIESFISD